MEKVILKFQLVLATIGGVLSAIYGESVTVVYALLILMAVDYITGVIKAMITKDVSSKIGMFGLFKKFMILVVILVATILDIIALNGAGVVASGTALFFMVNECISITENATEIGVPIPRKITELLAQIRSDSDE